MGFDDQKQMEALFVNPESMAEYVANGQPSSVHCAHEFTALVGMFGARMMPNWQAHAHALANLFEGTERDNFYAAWNRNAPDDWKLDPPSK